MKKTILIINWRDILNPEAGGAESYYHEIFKRIASREFEISVLAHAFPGAAKEEVVEGIKVIRRGGKFLFNFILIPWLLLNQKKFDLIIEDINKVPFFTPLYVRRPRLHMVMHFFGKSIYRETNFLLASYIYAMEKLVPIIYRKETFVAISPSTRDEITAFGIPHDHTHIVEPGIDTSFFYPTIPKSDPPVIAYVGRLMKYKNVQFIIRAMPELQKRVPGVIFEIGGTGDYLHELRSLTESLGIKDSIRFLGKIDEEQKRDLLSRATLFANPSSKEGWGINNIEANLCGTISLSSNVPGLRDSVQDGVTGILYDPDNIDDFCNKAVSVLQNPQLRAELENNSKSWAKTLDWENIARRMEKTLETVLS